jgi:hypothetical protein
MLSHRSRADGGGIDCATRMTPQRSILAFAVLLSAAALIGCIALQDSNVPNGTGTVSTELSALSCVPNGSPTSFGGTLCDPHDNTLPKHAASECCSGWAKWSCVLHEDLNEVCVP